MNNISIKWVALTAIVIVAAIAISYGSISGLFVSGRGQDSHDEIVTVNTQDDFIVDGEPAQTQIPINEPDSGPGSGGTAPSGGSSGGGSSGSSGGGGGSGGGSGSSGGTAVCNAQWSCTAWTECQESGTQTRTCVDTNGCGDNSGMPSESQSCDYVPPQEATGICDGICILPTDIQLSASENNSFTVQVYANTSKEIYGIEFDVMFDPELIDAVDIYEGDFLGSDGEPTFSIPQTNQDYAHYAQTRIGSDIGGVSGEGIIASIEFNVVGSGNADIVLGNVQVADDTASPIEIEYTGSSISITA